MKSNNNKQYFKFNFQNNIQILFNNRINSLKKNKEINNSNQSNKLANNELNDQIYLNNMSLSKFNNLNCFDYSNSFKLTSMNNENDENNKENVNKLNLNNEINNNSLKSINISNSLLTLKDLNVFTPNKDYTINSNNNNEYLNTPLSTICNYLPSENKNNFNDNVSDFQNENSTYKKKIRCIL